MADGQEAEQAGAQEALELETPQGFKARIKGPHVVKYGGGTALLAVAFWWGGTILSKMDRVQKDMAIVRVTAQAIVTSMPEQQRKKTQEKIAENLAILDLSERSR